MRTLGQDDTIEVIDVSAVARVRMWAWLGGFLVRLAGAGASLAITWLISDGDPLGVGDLPLVAANARIAEWLASAVGLLAGGLVFGCCWSLAAWLGRGSRAAGALALALAVAGVVTVVTWDYPTGESWVESVLRLTFLLAAPATLACCALAVLHSARRGAPDWADDRGRWQRHRYRRPSVVGALVVLVSAILAQALLLLMFLLVLEWHIPGAALGSITLAGSAGIFAAVRGLRRRATASAAEVAGTDSRPPVLYLRSFAADRVTIATVPTRHPAPSMRGRLEEVVAQALWRHGPVLAAAEPGVRSAPLGAARAQLCAGDWRPTLLTWISEAQLIVVAVGRGPGLMWELACASEVGTVSRVLFVVPPPPPRYPRTGWRAFDEIARREHDQQQFERRATWETLCGALDHDGEIWLPRDIDLARVLIVLPGRRGGRSTRPTAFTAGRCGDFSYEAALDIAVHRMSATATA